MFPDPPDDEIETPGGLPAPVPAADAVVAEGEAAVAAEAVAAEAVRPAPPVAPEERAVVIEALLFAAAEPLSPARLSGCIGGRPSDVTAAIEALNARYDTNRHALRVESVAGGYQMLTRPDLADHLRRLRGPSKDARLTPAAVETLAIVAYRQPILKADIEAIRGVQVAPTLKTLQERGLVRVVGRHESLGSPLLYGTTRGFLEHFGLASLKDLPKPEGATSA